MKMSSESDDRSESQVQFRTLRIFFAGAFSGAIAKTAVAPFDRTKILMQVAQMYGWSTYRGGVVDTMLTIWRTEGMPGFFRGNSATVARIMPYAAIQYSAFEFYNKQLSLRVFDPDGKSPMKRFIAGSLAGTTSVLLTYPIDLTRTILAVRIDSDHAQRNKRDGLVSTIYRIFRNEGIGGLYRGSYPTIVGVVPYSGTSFLSYGLLKRVADRKQFSERMPIATSLVCGGTAGLIAQCCTYPLDMVRRRLQALHSPTMMTIQERAFLRAARSGMSAGLFQFSIVRAILFILRSEGFSGLYRGVSLNFIKTAPAMSISFTCYDRMRVWLNVPPGKYTATTG